MMLYEELDSFLKKKQFENLSINTINAYNYDLNEFIEYLLIKGFSNYDNLNEMILQNYLINLEIKSNSISTIKRKLSSINVFLNYLFEKKLIKEYYKLDYKKHYTKRKKQVTYINSIDMNKILKVPKSNTFVGCRNINLIKLIYNTGIELQTLISLLLDDLDLTLELISIKGKKIPLKESNIYSLKKYLEFRQNFLAEKGLETNLLFINSKGGMLSRQYVWKTIREYGEKASLCYEVSPSIVRDSYIIRKIKNGEDLKQLKENLGVSSLQVFEKFLT